MATFILRGETGMKRCSHATVFLIFYKKGKDCKIQKENATHYLLCYIFLTPYISELGTIT